MSAGKSRRRGEPDINAGILPGASRLASTAGSSQTRAMRLNDKLTPIWGRRSIRVLVEAPLPDDVVEDLLRAAMAAPSAGAKDPWRFVVVRDRTMLQRLAGLLPYGRMLATAGVGIVVCGDPAEAHDQQLGYLVQDCAAAIENVLIASHLLGLGACWLGMYPREPRMAALRSLLGIPAAVIPVGGIAIGRPGEEKEARTRYNPDHVHHERW